MPVVARLALVAAVLSGALLAVLPGMSQAADTVHVSVVDNEYRDGDVDGNGDPSRTVITAGDTIAWVWGDGNQNAHTVTARADSPKQFDSDSECEGEDTSCREPGNVFAVTFEEPGTYPYYCKLHSPSVGIIPGEMTGTIEVQPASAPSEGGTTSEQPTDGGSSEPSGSESPSEPSGEGSSEPGSQPQDDPSSPPETSPADGSDDRDRRPTRRARAPGFGTRQQPETTGSDFAPEVAPEAVPEPSFSPFPTAPELSGDSETEEMAVNVPAPGGPARGVVVGIAIASVIGSAGAFGRIVLFGPPWS